MINPEFSNQQSENTEDSGQARETAMALCTMGVGGGFGATPAVALAYAVVAAVLFGLSKSSDLIPVSHPETPLAAPAE